MAERIGVLNFIFKVLNWEWEVMIVVYRINVRVHVKIGV